MFFVDHLELSWMAGGVRHTLRLHADGTPEVIEGAPPSMREPQGARLSVPARDKGRTGMPWTHDEEDEVALGYTGPEAIPELARKVRRTPAAVRARLVMLGVIEEADSPLRFPVKRPKPPTPVDPESDSSPF